MSRLKDMGLDVTTFSNGRPAFLAAVLEAMGIPQAFEQAHAEHRESGRLPEVPYGVLAKLLLINICDQHHPLYRMWEYFQDKDLELLAGYPVELDQLHDDRFGDFLDQFAQWGPRKMFSHMASQVFIQYGLSIRSLNYDTTSKAMWGEYEDPEGKVGTISITLGHSKEKRGDKNQLKIGLGVADGAILDAKVLSGTLMVDTFITQAWAPEDEALQLRAQEAVSTVAAERQDAAPSIPGFREVSFPNAHGQEVAYRVQDFTGVYRGETYQCAVCYSESLADSKRKTTNKHVAQEKDALDTLAKRYKKRAFACEADARKEIAVLQDKQLAKVLVHDVRLTVQPEEKKRRGRPKKNVSEHDKEYIYRLVWQIERNPQAEQILTEYKTQSSVEKKFQQLKSPHFVNSLYLKRPQRIEALVDMILTAMMVLSVVERVVRREMQAQEEIVIGPGKVRHMRPSLRVILDTFAYLPVNRVVYQGAVSRELINTINRSQQLIMGHLRLPRDAFTWTKRSAQ